MYTASHLLTLPRPLCRRLPPSPPFTFTTSPTPLYHHVSPLSLLRSHSSHHHQNCFTFYLFLLFSFNFVSSLIFHLFTVLPVHLIISSQSPFSFTYILTSNLLFVPPLSPPPIQSQSDQKKKEEEKNPTHWTFYKSISTPIKNHARANKRQEILLLEG